MAQGSIVCTGPIDAVARDLLQPFGEIVVCPDTTSNTLLPLLDPAIGLVVRGESIIQESTLDAAPNLKVIGRSGVGYNNVDIVAATARKIPVIFTPGAGARAVAEAAMTWMLALSKRIVFWDEQMKSGNWRSRHETKSGDLEGATLGIVGFGRIGQQLAKLADPFDMTILAYDPYVPAETMIACGVASVSLEELMSQADFISLHAAATEENRGLIDRDCLAHVKRGAYFINLARGDLVESLEVLQEALEDGRLAGVGLDVFLPEPPAMDHPIFQHPKLLSAPHSLASTTRAMYRIFESMAKDMTAVLQGERPRFVVNPEVFD